MFVLAGRADRPAATGNAAVHGRRADPGPLRADPAGPAHPARPASGPQPSRGLGARRRSPGRRTRVGWARASHLWGPPRRRPGTTGKPPNYQTLTKCVVMACGGAHGDLYRVVQRCRGGPHSGRSRLYGIQMIRFRRAPGSDWAGGCCSSRCPSPKWSRTDCTLICTPVRTTATARSPGSGSSAPQFSRRSGKQGPNMSSWLTLKATSSASSNKAGAQSGKDHQPATPGRYAPASIAHQVVTAGVLRGLAASAATGPRPTSHTGPARQPPA